MIVRRFDDTKKLFPFDRQICHLSPSHPTSLDRLSLLVLYIYVMVSSHEPPNRSVNGDYCSMKLPWAEVPAFPEEKY